MTLAWRNLRSPINDSSRSGTLFKFSLRPVSPSNPEKENGHAHGIQKLQRIPHDPLLVPKARHLPPLAPAPTPIHPRRTTSQPFLCVPQPLLRLPYHPLYLPQRPHKLCMKGQRIRVYLVLVPDARCEARGECLMDTEEGMDGVGGTVEEVECETCWCELRGALACVAGWGRGGGRTSGFRTSGQSRLIFRRTATSPPSVAARRRRGSGRGLTIHIIEFLASASSGDHLVPRGSSCVYS